MGMNKHNIIDKITECAESNGWNVNLSSTYKCNFLGADNKQ